MNLGVASDLTCHRWALLIRALPLAGLIPDLSSRNEAKRSCGGINRLGGEKQIQSGKGKEETREISRIPMSHRAT